MPTLHALQTWMLTVITDPAGVSSGADSATAVVDGQRPGSLNAVVCDTPDWPAAERLHIYWNAYLARLQECLRAEFPTLHAALGDDAFDEFAAGYVQTYPSTSYTLSRLGANLPRYLAATRPERDSDQPDWADFLIELAAHEWLLSEIFDGPGIEHEPMLTVPDLSQQAPEQLLRLKFETAPCLRLCVYRFPVQQFHADARTGQTPSPPAPQPTHLAVMRHNYIIRHFTLTESEYRLLECLSRRLTLGEALAALPADDESEIDLAAWFQRWVRAGFFTAIDAA
jgi:hypothetical protein